MILKKKYNEKTKTQKVWYESSMMVYSEMVESETENNGNLYVTFKNGATYCYKNVSFEDYLLLIAGGTDASQGKTLNKIIKSKYEYERVSDKNINDILNELNTPEENIEKNNTYFISGHRNLTENEFEYYYMPILLKIVEEDSNAKFVVGDCKGCDILAQNYLIDIIGINPERITVYCVGDTPENVNSNIIFIKNGFKNHIEKDIEMTNISFKDIAFVRDWREMSGTAQNILRRNSFL